MKDQRKTKTQLIKEVEALRQSEERYRQLFESANDAIISLTLDGIITATNRGAEALLGWFREEQIGRHYREFLTPSSVAFTEERARRIQAGEKVSSIYEIELLHKDGSVVPVEARSRFIRDREGKPIGILAIHRDITARKRAEATIIEWKNRYEAAIQASGQVLYDWDPSTNKVIWGANVGQLFGYCPEEMPGDLVGTIELIHPDDREAFQQEIDRVIATKESFRLEYRIRRKNGGCATVEDQGCFFRGSAGNLVRMVGFLVDITERKRAEEALRESEEKFRAQYRGIPIPTYTWQRIGEEFVLIDYNDAAAAITGGRIIDFLGKSAREMYQDQPEILEKFTRCFVDRSTSTEEIFYQLKTTGESKYFAISYAFVPPDLLMIHTEDITEREQAEEEKQKLQEQLFQARKLEALGTLAGGVAHDFNNILSAIMGFTELATDEVPQGTVARRNLEEVLKASRRAKTLVQQILTFSRPPQQELEPIRLQPIIEEMLTFLRASLPETIEVHRHIDKTAGPVAISSTQLQQVLTNLCSNATQALGERGGILEVSLRQIEVEGAWGRLQRNLQPGPHIRLTVSDTGCGMTPEILERIFEPFFTTRPVGEGNGLGLAIVHGIVTGHGGAITVESTPGKGTTFYVYLPVSEDGVAQENALHHSSSEGMSFGEERGALNDVTHFGY
jgi:PAS domain S-box-containing protein